jgi:ribosomal protein S18 acetylase RimI-like enzyme
MPAASVRAARPEDAEAILAVWVARDVADTGAPDYSLEDVRTDIAAEHIDALVVEEAGELLAVAALQEPGCVVGVHPEREGRGVGTLLREAVEQRARERRLDVMRMYVADLAVLREARGRGLGRGLLAQALATIRGAGLDGADLWVNGANTPALGLYESLGLRERERSSRWEKRL